MCVEFSILMYNPSFISLTFCLLAIIEEASTLPPHPHHAPRVDFDEVEFHRVRARGQIERLLNVRSAALDVVTAAKLHHAARGNFAAGPSLKICDIFKGIA